MPSGQESVGLSKKLPCDRPLHQETGSGVGASGAKPTVLLVCGCLCVRACVRVCVRMRVCINFIILVVDCINRATLGV